MAKNQIFTGNYTESLASYDPALSALKMLQTSFDWADPTLLDHLPQSGMIVNGLLYAVDRTSELPTDDPAGSVSDIPDQCLTTDALLPTPTATGSEHRTQYAQGGRPLMHMLLKGMLPTPTASTNYEPKDRGCWRRSTICRHILGVKAAQWEGVTQEQAIGEKLVLRPQFVEWMMGFPQGWTAPSTTESEKND